ncbi:DUF6298 domain-containing protein [Rhizosphaericola mali]|uniref:DUF6298 domain-containing protein n=1 Tax=Rhizosphaericola mali TaxID=2545455 RepID=UPI00177F93CA|nr:DUF6298 domain-containing protein [Rhizosphaericola mali]
MGKLEDSYSIMIKIYQFLFFVFLCFSVFAQKKPKAKPFLPISVENGKLVYRIDTINGDRIPDYSYAGYMSSDQAIPYIDVKAIVPIVNGDATPYIQTAIDYISQLPLNKDGFRGAILLQKGQYEIQGKILIKKSGIVIRGSGINQTVLLAKGIDRDGVIRIVGLDDRLDVTTTNVEEDYVPVNATSFKVADASKFKVGDQIRIKRPSTKEWIDALGTETFGGGVSALGWKPRDADLIFERKIIAVNGNAITIDVPLTNSLDKNYGGGIVTSFEWKGRIQNVGIENLSLVSDYNTKMPKDEDHRWMAINIENVEDAWVRQIEFQHFAGSAVSILETGRRITVEDCISLNPISEIGGQRRYTFFTRGQQTLFQRCYAVGGYHDFSAGFTAAGPNAFVQCESERPYSFSGTIDKWASGVLFDIVSVDGNAIKIRNREQDGRGAGWSGANCLLWNCSAAMIDNYKPPTAQNWALGSWSQFAGNGYWGESNNSLNPRSFFYAQLDERLGKKSERQSFVMDISTDASSSPSVAVAQALTAEAVKPKALLIDWIKDAAKHNAISTNASNVKVFNHIEKHEPLVTNHDMKIKNGWFVSANDEVLTGSVQEVPWWTGGVEAEDLEQAKKKLAITRFVPGRVGQGLTDDMDEVVDSMVANNIAGLNQHYALWYERRRDDHERIRRMDGEVWPPFYELPFKRSGIDSAWDGLSKYDLTQYNQWYWWRMKEFATIGAISNRVLLHQNYFQHNIIEAGAHYADFPWRTANNINNTGFNEPVNFAGDKRIFYAEQFYDITQPTRKRLHQLYIQKCLENFKDNSNVIQFTGEEFTGPLHFVQFWLETINDWEKKNVKELIGLSTTKDVQDAILQDPKYSSIIDVIDIKYWHYQADGKLYAPEGGKNLAPRQWARLLKPKATSFEQVYRAVKEYKTLYPNKMILYSGDGAVKNGWAVFMAGGSLATIPKMPTSFLKQISLTTIDSSLINDGIYTLSNKKDVYVYYTNSEKAITPTLLNSTQKFDVTFFSAKDGSVLKELKKVNGQSLKQFQSLPQASIIWIRPVK